MTQIEPATTSKLVDEGAASFASDRCLFTNNSALYGGVAAIMASPGRDTMGTIFSKNSTFLDNRAKAGGGVFYSQDYGHVKVVESQMENNEAQTVSGGAIWGASNTYVELVNSTISRCRASMMGGAVANNGTIRMTSMTFSENMATVGGAVCAVNVGNATVDEAEMPRPLMVNTRFLNNSVSENRENSMNAYQSAIRMTGTLPAELYISTDYNDYKLDRFSASSSSSRGCDDGDVLCEGAFETNYLPGYVTTGGVAYFGHDIKNAEKYGKAYIRFLNADLTQSDSLMPMSHGQMATGKNAQTAQFAVTGQSSYDAEYDAPERHEGEVVLEVLNSTFHGIELNSSSNRFEMLWYIGGNVDATFTDVNIRSVRSYSAIYATDGANVTFDNLAATNVEGLNGGVASVDLSDLTVVRSKFINCSAARGGALSVSGSGNNDGWRTGLTVRDTSFLKCAAQQGGAFAVESATADVQQTEFDRCWAVDVAKEGQPCGCEEAGSKFCNYDDDSTGSCEDCSNFDSAIDCYNDGLAGAGAMDCVNRCFAGSSMALGDKIQRAQGGAMHLFDLLGEPIVQDVEFSKCSAVHDGGGVFFESNGRDYRHLSMANNTFELNMAGKFGGGVFTGNDTAAFTAQSTFTGNEAFDRGGALFAVEPVGSVVRSKFFNNRAYRRGGAVSIGLLRNDTGYDSGYPDTAAPLNGVDYEFDDGTPGGNYRRSYAINQTVFANNSVHATFSAGGIRDVGGGAVHATAFHSLIIHETHFVDNFVATQGFGSAVHTEATPSNVGKTHRVVITDALFENNRCRDYTGVGDARDMQCGAVSHIANCTEGDSQAGSVYIHATVFNENGGGYGAGGIVINALSTCTAPDVHVEHTNFTKNDGGIGAVGADLMVKECNFINNVQNYWGGAAIHNRFGKLTIDKAMMLDNQVIRDGSATQSEYARGGAIFQLWDSTRLSAPGESRIDDVVLSGNQYSKVLGEQGISGQGGGLVSWEDPGTVLFTRLWDDMIDSDYGVQVINTTFQSGFLYHGVGKAMVQNLDFDFTGCDAARCGTHNYLTVDWQGGLITVVDNATLEVTDCSFQGVVNSEKGGAISTTDSDILIRDVSFTKTISASGGGAIASEASEVKLQRVTFDKTAAVGTGANGGALYSIDDEKLVVEDTSFVETKASHSGGAIHAHLSRFVMVNRTTFYRSHAGNDGGAVDVKLALYQVVEDSEFIECAARGRNGGSIATDAYQVVVKTSNFSGGWANMSGGCLHAGGLGEAISISDSLFRNCSTRFVGTPVSTSRSLSEPNGTLTAVGGGAVTIFVPPTVGSNYTAYVTGTTFVQNVGRGAGSALLFAYEDTGNAGCDDGELNKALVANTKFIANTGKGNVSQYDGGALSYFADQTHCGVLTVYSSTFEHNTIAGASSGAGLSGRVTRTDGRRYSKRVFITERKKTYSTMRDFYETNLMKVDVVQTSFDNNDGAISTQGASPLSVSDSTFTNNTATYRGGGAIRSEKGSIG